MFFKTLFLMVAIKTFRKIIRFTYINIGMAVITVSFLVTISYEINCANWSKLII